MSELTNTVTLMINGEVVYEGIYASEATLRRVWEPTTDRWAVGPPELQIPRTVVRGLTRFWRSRG